MVRDSLSDNGTHQLPPLPPPSTCELIYNPDNFNPHLPPTAIQFRTYPKNNNNSITTHQPTSRERKRKSNDVTYTLTQKQEYMSFYRIIFVSLAKELEVGDQKDDDDDNDDNDLLPTIIM